MERHHAARRRQNEHGRDACEEGVRRVASGCSGSRIRMRWAPLRRHAAAARRLVLEWPPTPSPFGSGAPSLAPYCTSADALAAGPEARKEWPAPRGLGLGTVLRTLDAARSHGIGSRRMDERTKQTLVLGREHYAKREFDTAEPLLREVLETEDRFADIHDMLGVIAHSRGNFIAAEKHFERALAFNPAYTEAALNLAVTYNDRGKYEKAREVYSRIQGAPNGAKSGLDPFARGKIANMHADVGQAYADAGLPLEAILELEKALDLCPHFADLRTKLGTLLREVNEVARAKEQYEAAIATRPNFVPARLQLGVTLLSLGDPDGAAEQWNKVIEIDPDNSRAKMYLRMLSLNKMKTAPPAGPGSAPPQAPPA